MKAPFTLLVTLLALPIVCAGLDITTRTGKTYRACKVTRLGPDGLGVIHSGGVTTIAFRDLPASLQQEYHYDAVKGRRHPEEAAREAYEASMRPILEAQQAAERQAEEDRRKRAETLQAEAAARIRAEESFRARERALQEREEAVRQRAAALEGRPPATENPMPPRIAPAPAEPAALVRRPASGGMLYDRFPGDQGAGKLTVDNGTDHNAIVKLVDTANDTKICSFLVLSRDRETIEGLPDGKYRIIFAFGDAIVERTDRFDSPEGYSEFKSPLPFATTKTFDGYQYSTFTVTLHKVLQGNARTGRISAEEYNKY